MEVKKRENWGSTLGFVLAIAGSAIGLGNVWKFPYITGQNGIVLDGWHYSTGPAFSETELSASVCRACRKIIVEYC